MSTKHEDQCSDDCPYYTPHLGADDFCQNSHDCECREAEAELFRDIQQRAKKEVNEDTLI